MRTLLCLLFCLCFTHKTFAQNQSDTTDKKYAITMSAVIFPYKSGIQPGFQIKLGKQFGLMSDFGFALSDKGNNRYNEMHFFKLASELKYYSRHSVNGRYFSLQAGYVHREFQANDSGWYWRKDSSDATGYGSALVNSPVFFGAVKLGREMKIGEKFLLDFFLGIGARYIRTTYHVQGIHPIKLGGVRDDIFELAGYSWEHEGEQLKLHATAGVRVGCYFR
ncbi:MAG TPA: DUF3575 domain-containing protein [Flavisolibacter sp.]|nr:DUF3575 domain-containing protein [Flavisolibacter sp.]